MMAMFFTRGASSAAAPTMPRAERASESRILKAAIVYWSKGRGSSNKALIYLSRPLTTMMDSLRCVVVGVRDKEHRFDGVTDG
jgi:hypothetical protein